MSIKCSMRKCFSERIGGWEYWNFMVFFCTNLLIAVLQMNWLTSFVRIVSTCRVFTFIIKLIKSALKKWIGLLTCQTPSSSAVTWNWIWITFWKFCGSTFRSSGFFHDFLMAVECCRLIICFFQGLHQETWWTSRFQWWLNFTSWLYR